MPPLIQRLRKHLRGVIQFVQDCARGGMIGNYDFDSLRRKLGLLGEPAASAAGLNAGAEHPAADAAGSPLNIAAMGTAELAALNAANFPTSNSNTPTRRR